MGDRPLTACIYERLAIAQAALLADQGVSLQDWYDAGCDEAGLDWRLPEAQLGFTASWAYLEGVADAHDATVMELVERVGRSLEPPPELAARARTAGRPPQLAAGKAPKRRRRR